jgi:tryptophanyl-tRNA synthetase
MSLKDGTKKMSKSDPSDLSRINLTDTKDQIVNKIKKAKTDTERLPDDDENLSQRPEVENLLGIYSSLSNQSLKNSINEFSGKNFSEFKEKLVDLVVEKISPISIEINKLQKDNNHIDTVLKEGGKRANVIASKKVEEMKKIVGF